MWEKGRTFALPFLRDYDVITALNQVDADVVLVDALRTLVGCLLLTVMRGSGLLLMFSVSVLTSMLSSLVCPATDGLEAEQL